MFSSCSESFLNMEPKSYLGSSDFYKTEGDIEQALVGAYDALQSTGQYGFFFSYLMEVPSDNSISRSITNSGGIYGDFELFRVTSSNTILNSTWTDCYLGIQRCNIVLNRISDIDMDAETKKQRIGEALFLRALTYFNLVRIWGGVPIVLNEIEDPIEAFNHGRVSADEVYNRIIADLDNAITNLSGIKNSNGRADWGACKALLAKVYLTQGEFSKSSEILSEIIDSKQYKLLENYSDIFDVKNKNHEESIFEVQYLAGGYGEGSSYANNFAPSGDNSVIGGVGVANGDNEPTQELTNLFSQEDSRITASIDTSDNGQLFTPKFNDIPFQQDDANNNFIVLRYADVLLMYAEALNEISYEVNGDAFKYLNQVRKRAGVDTLNQITTANQELFRKAVAKERRLELAFENHRWFDLVRTGNAIEVMNSANSPHGNLNVQEYQLLFPIPQPQIDAINNKEIFYQNPGYN